MEIKTSFPVSEAKEAMRYANKNKGKLYGFHVKGGDRVHITYVGPLFNKHEYDRLEVATEVAEEKSKVRFSSINIKEALDYANNHGGTLYGYTYRGDRYKITYVPGAYNSTDYDYLEVEIIETGKVEEADDPLDGVTVYKVMKKDGCVVTSTLAKLLGNKDVSYVPGYLAYSPSKTGLYVYKNLDDAIMWAKQIAIMHPMLKGKLVIHECMAFGKMVAQHNIDPIPHTVPVVLVGEEKWNDAPNWTNLSNYVTPFLQHNFEFDKDKACFVLRVTYNGSLLAILDANGVHHKDSRGLNESKEGYATHIDGKEYKIEVLEHGWIQIWMSDVEVEGGKT